MIGIVTVNWNAYKMTLNFIDQVLLSDLQEFRLVIVNNSPQENTLFDLDETIRDPRIEIIHTGENVGYSGGLNRGIQWLIRDPGVDHLLLTNNDVEFDKAFLRQLTTAGAKADSIYAPVILYQDTDLIQSTGGRVIKGLGTAMNLNKNVPIEKVRVIEPDFLTGCMLYMSRRVVEKVGLFDQRYGSYWEDVDYSYRAKREGIRLEVLWGLTAHHFHSYSSKGYPELKTFLLNRNQIIFAMKHLSPAPRTLFIIAAILRGFVESLLKGQVIAFFRGIRDGFKC